MADEAERKTTNYHHFEGMDSQNNRYGCARENLFWLENIMRIGNGDLHSIPGPSGVLNSVPIPATGCPETTLPGVQEPLTQAHFWNYNTGIPPGTLNGNCAENVNFIGDNDDVIVWISERSGFGTDYATGTPYCISGVCGGHFQVLHIQGASVTAVPQVPLPGWVTSFTVYGQEAQSGQDGHSDEQCYFLTGTLKSTLFNGTVDAYFSWPSQEVFVMKQPGSVGPWSKFSTNFYHYHGPLFPNAGGLFRYVLQSGVVVNPVVSNAHSELGHPCGLSASPNFLYVLYPSGVLYQMHKETLDILQQWDLNSQLLPAYQTPNVLNIDAVSDDVIYLSQRKDGIGTGGSNTRLYFYYFQPSNGTLTAINPDFPYTVAVAQNPAFTSMNHFFFLHGYLYIGYGGLAYGTTNLEKIGVLNCPGQSVPIGTPE